MSIEVANLETRIGARENGAFAPSPYQQTIFDFIRFGRGDGIVSAVAGSGKTTTLVQGAKLIGSSKAVFFAFNKHIAESLKTKLAGTTMEARTIHSAGMRALTKALGGRTDLQDFKYRTIAERMILENLGELSMTNNSKEKLRQYTKLLDQMISFTRLLLLETEDRISAMLLERNLGGSDVEYSVLPKLIGMVLPAIREGIRLAQGARIIDFTDMIYLPNVLNLDMDRYDWVLVDEAQDLCIAQRELVLKSRAPGGRMLFVGDPRQAIMAFAGADAKSYWEIKTRTGATELPLSICYRCPQSHIDLAKLLVPEIEAAPNAIPGTVERIKQEDVEGKVQENDLLICRKTAPLVALCIKLIQKKIPARVRGRDVADALTKKAREIASQGPFEMFPALVENYREAQLHYLVMKKNPSQAQIQLLTDTCEALEVCWSAFTPATVEQLCAEIDGIFSDGAASVWLSTVHRTKGLEAERVFVLQYDELPMRWKDQSDEQLEQELNLKYVALTRSKRDLFLVGTPNK